MELMGDDGDAKTRPAPPTSVEKLHPDLVPLGELVGEWSGLGHGTYPTIEPFDYLETLHFGHVGKPFLTYLQRTRAASDGKALHVETGYLRPAGMRRVELVLAQPTGIVEVDEGSYEPAGGATVDIRLCSRMVGLSSSAKEVTRVERTFRLEGGVLYTTVAMAAVGHPLTHHLASELHRMGS